MFLMMVAAIVVATVPLFGGRLARLSTLRVRLWWLVVAALAVQVLVISVFPAMPGPLAAALHVSTYVAGGVVMWCNRRTPGVLVIAAGALLNGVAIVANGGSLPASAAALRAAGWTEKAGDFANSAPVAHPVLGFLGDNYVTPSFLPFRNVFSVGDVVLLVGAAILVHAICGSLVARHVSRWTAALSAHRARAVEG